MVITPQEAQNAVAFHRKFSMRRRSTSGAPQAALHKRRSTSGAPQAALRKRHSTSAPQVAFHKHHSAAPFLFQHELAAIQVHAGLREKQFGEIIRIFSHDQRNPVFVPVTRAVKRDRVHR